MPSNYTTTIRKGETRFIYGTVYPSSFGAVIIDGTSTFTLYDPAGNAVAGLANIAVTDHDRGNWTVPSSWYLLNTAALTPGRYELTFTIIAEDINGNTITEMPQVVINLISVFDPTPTDYVQKPASTYLGPSTFWNNNYVVATKAQQGTSEQAVTAGNFLVDANLKGSYGTTHVFVTQASLIRVAFLNESLEGLNTNAVTYAASLRYGGVNYKFTFGGNPTGVAQIGALLVSDPLQNLSIPQGAAVQFITSPSVASAGMKWPLSIASNSTVAGEGYTTNVDYTSVLTNPISVTGYTCAPSAILGVPSAGAIAQIALVGDSIITGIGDAGSAGGGYEMGFAARGLNNSFGYVRVSLSGETAATFASPSSSILRRQVLAGCTHAIIEYGNNDIFAVLHSAATTAADITKIVAYLVSKGIICYVCTVTPRATSTDGFTSATNQTTNANNPARITLNGLIRAGITGAAGYIEIADPVETARDSGKWLFPGYTTDGTHPLQIGATAISVNIPVLQFTV